MLIEQIERRHHKVPELEIVVTGELVVTALLEL